MCKLRLSALAIALAAVATCGLASAARADLKIVQSVTFDSPQMKRMMEGISAQQHASLANSGMDMFSGHPVPATFTSSGKMYRVEMGPQIGLLNGNNKTLTILNKVSHTYQSMPYDPNAGSPPGESSSVQDTGQTKTVLGHKVRRYTISVTSPAMGGAKVSGDVWAAMDIPQPPSMGPAGGPTAIIQAQMKKIKGMPLESTIHVTGGMAGAMTVKSIVKSISTQKLPANAFAIPAGFKAGGGSPMGR